MIKVNDLIWDLDLLQQTPEFTYLDSTSRVRQILFKGPDHKDKSTQVFAYYSNPDILKTGKNQGNTFPGVVLISGGDQSAMSEWVERWAHEGYAAITCDYGNTKLQLGRGPVLNTLEERLAIIYDSIAQGPKVVRGYRTAGIAILAHSLLLSFPEVENNKTAVTGISWGGFQTCIVSGIDNRFKAAAPVYGCAFHDEIIFKKYFKNLTKEEKSLWMSKIDPKNYLPFSQCPTLFINGNKDGCFDIVPFDKTTKLIPEKNRFVRITPNMGHDHPVGWRPREIAAFFNSIFKGSIPLAKITGIEKWDSVIKFDYDSKVTLKNANFYYTNDTLNINANRTWNSIPAKISGGGIVSPIPQEGYVMGFLYVTDVMDLGVSSELIIN
ncbi:alpha/beta hydrolase family protein [Arenibacter sp. N53]|uniref:alpha/beta hydrolase family protein n=1 Tax=Arenibacter sp. N53 TaxID=2183746 RepID=UPI001300136D|nr:dienelactone hydrolase family protein [Arenibacter sp. N53]